jgi:hypothetical protein
MTLQKTIRFSLWTLALGATLSLLVPAISNAEEAKEDLPRAKNGPSTKSLSTPATAPNARLAALIRPGPQVVRQKGITGLSNPSVGLYCINPEPGINPTNSIVIVSPEFHFSDVNEVKVQWFAGNSACGADRIAVVTLEDFNLDGRYVRSDHVAFSIVVP